MFSQSSGRWGSCCRIAAVLQRQEFVKLFWTPRNTAIGGCIFRTPVVEKASWNDYLEGFIALSVITTVGSRQKRQLVLLISRSSAVWISIATVNVPPSPSGAIRLGEMVISNLKNSLCSMRFFPHLQDTGGFFVAVLEKVKPMTWTPSVQNVPATPDLELSSKSDKKGL